MTHTALDAGHETAGDPSAAADGDAGWPPLPREDERVAALREFNVLGRDRQPDLDALARLAAHICGTPTATVDLVDADRQCRIAVHGVAAQDVDRRHSIAARVLVDAAVVHVRDARLDPRFSDLPEVSGRGATVRFLAAAPLVTHDGHALGALTVTDEQVRELGSEQLDLLADLADQVMALFQLRRLAAALARVSSRDSLTGLDNRRAMEQSLTAAIARAERGLGTPSVVVVDINGLQGVNDASGHAAGDALLREVAQRLTATARLVDSVARISGDEFAVLLEHTGGSGATAALARLRRSLAAPPPDLGTGRPVPAALGMAIYRPGDTAVTMLARADAEMYTDKASLG